MPVALGWIAAFQAILLIKQPYLRKLDDVMQMTVMVELSLLLLAGYVLKHVGDLDAVSN